MRAKPSLSVIVTTYNWPQALELVLQALNQQTYRDFEVIVADDGSTHQTEELLHKMQCLVNFPLIHVWQKDQGFRAAKIRNKAVVKASGDYLIFIDGDCLTKSNFIACHLKLALKNFFVAGNRVLLSEQFSQKIFAQKINVPGFHFLQYIKARIKGDFNRLLPLISLPLGKLRYYNSHRWQAAKTCNLAMWKKDFLKVNGLDESYEGWGYEDSDLVIRLLRANILHKSGRFLVPVLHLWHPLADRSHEQENLARLEQIIKDENIWAKDGVDKYFYS